MTPLDIFKETMGTFPAMFVKLKHNLLLTLTK